MKGRLSAMMLAAINWEPDPGQRVWIVAAGFLTIVLIGFAHYASGLAYEFHTFYVLAVMALSWYVGMGAGFLAAVFSAVDWLLVDWFLIGGDIDVGVIVFNELVRLSVFLVVTLLTASLRAHLRQEAASARTDPLTRLANRRRFYEEGRIELERARRSGAPLTVVFIDVDDFKRVNDTMGHDAGDEVLRCVAEVLRNGTRLSDLAARFGGDEFAILMPETDAEAAAASARKLQALLLERMADGKWPVNFSIGVATCNTPPDDVDTLVRRADALMYQVKLAGKNTVRCEML